MPPPSISTDTELTIKCFFAILISNIAGEVTQLCENEGKLLWLRTDHVEWLRINENIKRWSKPRPADHRTVCRLSDKSEEVEGGTKWARSNQKSSNCSSVHFQFTGNTSFSDILEANSKTKSALSTKRTKKLNA